MGILDTVREPRESGTTVLLVEQNTRSYVIDLGRTTLSGNGRTLLADLLVQDACLGDGVGS